MARIDDDRLIDRIYSAAADPARWEAVLDDVIEACGGGVGVLLAHDVDAHDGLFSVTARLEPDWSAAYNSYYAARNPWLLNLPKRPVGLTTPAEFMLERSQLVKTEFYDEWLRPQGLASGLGVTLLRTDQRFVAFSLLYSDKSAQRAREHVELVQRLSPHLLRAYQINRQLAVSEFRWRAAEASLEQLAAGVVVLDASGRLVFANASARELIADEDGLSFDGQGRLRADSAAADARLQQLIAAAVARTKGRSAAAGALAVERRSGRAAYSVLVSPLQPPESILNGMERAVIVFVNDPTRRQGPDADTLITLFGLTPAEARLAVRLSDGESLRMTAGALGVSYETARNVLKRIFMKTGVSRQSELAALLTRLVLR